MMRRVDNLLTSASLLLCVAAAALWVRHGTCGNTVERQSRCAARRIHSEVEMCHVAHFNSRVARAVAARPSWWLCRAAR